MQETEREKERSVATQESKRAKVTARALARLVIIVDGSESKKRVEGEKRNRREVLTHTSNRRQRENQQRTPDGVTWPMLVLDWGDARAGRCMAVRSVCSWIIIEYFHSVRER